jgi:hypothetical protein
MDESAFGGGTSPGTMAGGNTDSSFGSGLNFGGGADVAGGVDEGTDVLPVNAQPTQGKLPQSDGFGSALRSVLPGPNYNAPDPQMTALDQTADTLQQRIKRANEIATNPMLQFFSPDGVQRARDFVPAATEKLQQIRTQQAAIKAGKQQAATLGLEPGEVADEATQADRVEVAKARALTGDLKVFKGLQAVDPKAAEAIQDQVHEVAAAHLGKAQYAFDKLSNMRNQGEYSAAVTSLRRDGTLRDLEALGLKVPPSFDAFSAAKGREGQALREARIGIDTVRAKLEERNTYQPMEKKEAETYTGRLTTVHGDQITNGTWGRNASSNARGLIVNGAADPRDLGKKYTLASPEQRKAIAEEINQAVPKADLEKQRAFDRTYELATTDAKGNPVPPGQINTNPNVQQGIAEGLASMLRGGTGGANVGLLQIETNKRGFVQGVLDSIMTNYSGALNTLSEKDVRPYLTKLTQSQIRDVMEVIKGHNDHLLEDRVGPIARRAGALGLDTTAFGFGKEESAGVIAKAIEQGRQEQIERMLPNHQAVGGGDGVFQLGAQRPGAGATSAPPGTGAVTQLPGAPPVATPVQQAQNPTAPPAPAGSSGGGAPPAAPNQAAPSPTGGPGGSGPAGGGTPAPQTIAGQTINVALPPGASPDYLRRMQRIESGNEKNPWTASAGNGPDGKPLSSAGGAFQFINSTWAASKPPGAPDSAKAATPQQQAEALATLTAKNSASLQANKLPVNDTTLYIAHNLGAGGAATLLQADPNADARTVVGEQAARNNPTFFKGRPTVAKVLERYTAEMNAPDEGPKPQPGAGGATAEAPSFMQRVSRVLSQGVAGGDAAKDKAVADVGKAAVEHAPAIASTAGAIGGAAVGGPVGAVAGGAAGGGAGQSLKDYLQGNDQSPAAIAKETALGGVLGVTSVARPVAAVVARTAGAGGVEAGAAAAEGKDAGEVVDAGVKGSVAGAVGETFGRALGMVGHKVWNMFAPDAKKAVQTAAGKYADAEAVLAAEAKTLPSVNGVGGGPNPKYLTAEANKLEAERTLKDAGLKPEEAAYAHRVSSEGVPKQEAEAARPGVLEQERLGKGYDRLTQAVDETGKGAVKAAPKLVDGPRAAVENKKVSAKHAELAERVEAAITAPAPDWKTKWTQLQKARSDLLEAERDALASTVPGKSQTARDMRALADTVRKQQEKAAKYVFGEKDGEKFMGYMKVLDVRYRNLMEATNGGELAKAAATKGEAGREAERKFVAFAHDDPQAIAAYRAMRGARGDVAEATVPWTVAAEGLPVVGKVVKVAKLASILRDWARERAAGNPVKFGDLIKTGGGTAEMNQAVRDLLGTAAQRGATMQ